jgi:ferredoxin-type protein NapH
MHTLTLRARLIAAGCAAAALWGIGAGAWAISQSLAPLIFFGYLGTIIAPGILFYLGLPPAKRSTGRRPLVAAIGIGMLAAALARVLAQHSIVAVEGFFFELFSGVAGAALLHFAIAKLFGPLIFGRVYCGWACWTGALLDLLPFRHSTGRRRGFWRYLRYLHLLVSLCLVAALWFGFTYLPDRVDAVVWFIAGVALYYVIGVALAFGLKDNRAFCKYLCPAGVLALPATRFSLLKVQGDPQRCNALGECVAACPMDICITDYTHHGVRVLSSECILCQACINACPDGSLSLSFGIDPPGRLELLRDHGGAPPVTIIPRSLRKARRKKRARKSQ